jgi:hypothetical protein
MRNKYTVCLRLIINLCNNLELLESKADRLLIQQRCTLNKRGTAILPITAITGITRT